MAQDDEQLVTAIVAGDREAFACLYRKYKDELLTTAACLLSGDRSAAEDVVHDVFVALARRASDLNIQTSLHGYLVKACLNRVRDLQRRRYRMAGRGKDPDQQAADELGAAERVSVAEESQRALSALAAIPSEQREVVTLKIHSQLTFREIAELLGISINTVQSRYRYALARMRSRLGIDKASQGN